MVDKCDWKIVVDGLEDKLLGLDPLALRGVMPNGIDCFECSGYDLKCPYYVVRDKKDYS